jgi:hypothetical protein
MSFIYRGSDISGSNELYTFTNNGCIGIGSTQPVYAVDAYASSYGTIGLRDTSNLAQPLIVFGAGASTDYRMVTSNNSFYFNTYTSTNQQQSQILTVDSTSTLTVGAAGGSTNIAGNLNIAGGLLLGGVPFVSSGVSGSVTFMTFSNITVNPFDATTNPYGGFAINTQVQTSNLFYIGSGKNQNMMVLDSAFDQAQIHFRTTNTAAGAGNTQSVYRMNANNSNFEWKYYPNYNVSSAPLYFSDDNLPGYSNVFSFGASGRTAGAAYGDFDTNVFGSLILKAPSGSPNIFFGSNTTRGVGSSPYITSSNNALVFYAPANIGIGTTTPIAPLTVVASNIIYLPNTTASSNVPVVFAVQQLGRYGNIAHLYNYSNEGVMINNVGYVGINTLFPQSNLHVVGNVLVTGKSTSNDSSYAGATLEIFGNAITHNGNTITDSDASVKTDLVRIEAALNKVKALTGYTFTNITTGKRGTGLIAQDVQAVLPEAVYTEGSILGLAYGNLMGLMVEAIKDLSNEIDGIKARLTTANL